MVYCSWFAHSFETLYDCTEATGRTNIFDYKLIPYIIYKIRKGLQEAIDSQTSTEYIRSIAAEMILIFNKHFVQGDAGTVAMENLETGKRKWPKGVNILALMASFLDPRMKGGVGLLNEDK